MSRWLKTAVTLVVLVVMVGAIAGMGDDAGAPPPKPELPDGLKPWSFLVGDWDLATQRLSSDGEIIEEENGSSTFSIAPGGRVLLESEHSMLNGNQVETLNMIVFNPRRDEIEIARSDSAHHAINIKRGTITGDRIDLVEKHPNADSDITRRWTYVKTSDDAFVIQLDFSQDGGETWFARNRAAYTRRK